MIDAVTAILVCDDEVFVIKRQPHLRAFPGYLAFPGGKIDLGDQQSGIEHPLIEAHPQTHITALRRELLEELDFDLGGALSSGTVREISLFGTAITPEFERLRFNAHYYKIVLERKPGFVFETNEIAEGGWQKAATLRDLFLRGQALMVVPMRNTLFQLAADISASTSREFNLVIPENHLPCLELIDGLRTIPVPSNTLPPARATNALLLGDEGQRQVLVDPSPESDQVYTCLWNTLASRRVDAILLTHHHPDHHERAPQLARALGIPVLLSERTLYRLQRGWGEKYLAGVELELVDEGSLITHWKRAPVRAYSLPGHDDGMLGLAPDTLDWFFVADLAQTGGSIVIPDEGGDLTAYFSSLRRVIDLEPKVIMPSHGIPSGGTAILEKTLQHRIDREQQIRPLYEAKASVSKILYEVYPGLEPRLEKLAVQTIHQHIRKLDEEKAP